MSPSDSSPSTASTETSSSAVKCADSHAPKFTPTADFLCPKSKSACPISFSAPPRLSCLSAGITTPNAPTPIKLISNPVRYLNMPVSEPLGQAQPSWLDPAPSIDATPPIESSSPVLSSRAGQENSAALSLDMLDKEKLEFNDLIIQVGTNGKPKPSRKRSKPIRSFYDLNPVKSLRQFPNLSKGKQKHIKIKKPTTNDCIDSSNTFVSNLSIADGSISDGCFRNRNALIAGQDSTSTHTSPSVGEQVWDVANQLGIGLPSEKDNFINYVNNMDALDKKTWESFNEDDLD